VAFAWAAKRPSGSIEKVSAASSRLLVDCVPISPAPCETRTETMFSGLTMRLMRNDCSYAKEF